MKKLTKYYYKSNKKGYEDIDFGSDGQLGKSLKQYLKKLIISVIFLIEMS